MKKQEILETLSVVEKEHVKQAIDKLVKEGVPNNRVSYLYDVKDPETGNNYPPPYLLETAHKIATGKNLPKGFFDKIKNNGPHFQKLRELGYTIETKWHDDLDLSSKVWSYKWLYTLTTNQWNRVLDAGKVILDRLDLKAEDPKLVISFRDDAKQRLAILIGSKYVGGFYLEKDEVYLRFYVNENFDVTSDTRLSPDSFEFANKIGKLVYMKLDEWKGDKDPLVEQILNDVSSYYEIAPKTNWKRNHLPFMTSVIRHQGPRRRFLSFVRQNPQERLIDIYKYYLKTTGNEDELYKWELGKQFKDNWDLQAKDFSAMLSSVKSGNLLSQQATSFYNLARKNPEDARDYYTYLFNDEISIQERIQGVKDRSADLMKKWHPTWTNSGQDERTLSVFWAFDDLTKHAIYKSSFYTAYCDLIGVKVVSPGDKYSHYLELLNDLIEIYIKKDQELITLQNKSIDPSKHIEDPNYHLLAQNMLYRILDGYWVWENESKEETKMNYREVFENWIKKNNSESSNMASSYMRAMDLLDGVLDYPIYEETDTNKLKQLYDDLIANQGNETGIYLGAGPVSYGKNGYYSAAVRKYIEFHQQKQNSTDMSENKRHPLNQILYGPPGTGKTFKLKSQFFDRYTTKETSISKEQKFEETVRDLTWWQVIALALIEEGTSKVNDLIDNRWVSHKAAISESKNVRATIWGSLQMHTIQESTTVAYTQRQAPLIFDKTNDKSWNLLENEAKEQTPELYEIIESINNFNPNPDKEIKRYVFTTFHQSYSYEDFIEGIKPIMSEEEVIGSVGYGIENGIFKDLCERASRDSDNQYAIFIDEINRGNVSAIFGELITLIEVDKRKNGKNPMSVTLPYSKKLFSVPSNVDIIGTMNTADRSVEALDTALRRRFTFEEMLPNPSLLKEQIDGISLEKLLTTINERIEVLVDRDHTIGHAYFMEVKSIDTLRNVFANKVIPLLQEYFYGDYAKMEMVIGPDFFNKEKRTKKVAFAVSNEDIEIPSGSYELVNVMDVEFDIEAALIRLLNNK
ncbi:MAG: AAA family ATPase [Crocinitomicaceae bacterium]|nr:AAA family ATPase [Crocinitomicaceae bacterium]